MKPQHLLLLAPVACAYTLHHQQRHPTFTTGTPINTPRGSGSSANFLRMDTEVPTLDTVTSYNLEKTLKNIRLDKGISLRQAEAQRGMPWKSSIDPKVKDDDLLYMPFWEWQMQFMEENFTNLKVVPCHNGKTDFSYNENEKKKARIVNLCATSDEYRKIRMTYYDAGEATQVFNAVLYPDPELNLPVLGVDILCFNRKKYLAIVDFQPIHDTEEEHAARYEHLLEPIKEKYDSLKGRMSSKFYDETQHFSQQMLFARFDDEEIVSRDLFPAFQSYVKTHLDLVRSTERRPEDVKFVLECQKEYDTYSADRDPATGLFAAMFGAEWANDFVHDFLFSMSERTEGGPPPAMPFMGGPPPTGAAAGGPPRTAAGAPPTTTQTHRP
jgi:15,16-dihydrobiliverdin:ferredoxin oxidoreductase